MSKLNISNVRNFIVILLVSVVALGCNDSERDEDLETLTVREMSLAYHILDDAWREVHRIAMQDTLIGSPDSATIKGYFLNSCVEEINMSDTAAVFPLYMSIKYGFKDYSLKENETKICDDGFRRYGRINASFTGKYLNKGSVVEITFQDYAKDDFKVEGVSRMTNLGLDSDGYMRFLWEVEDCRITSVNTDFTWEGTHEYTWVAGRSIEDQGQVFDDVFKITGFSEGRNSRGNTFSNEVTEVYLCDYSCQWFTSGRSILNIPNLEVRTLNYGDAGKCDNIVIERRNNTYFDVEIPY